MIATWATIVEVLSMTKYSHVLFWHSGPADGQASGSRVGRQCSRPVQRAKQSGLRGLTTQMTITIEMSKRCGVETMAAPRTRAHRQDTAQVADVGHCGGAAACFQPLAAARGHVTPPPRLLRTQQNRIETH